MQSYLCHTKNWTTVEGNSQRCREGKVYSGEIPKSSLIYFTKVDGKPVRTERDDLVLQLKAKNIKHRANANIETLRELRDEALKAESDIENDDSDEGNDSDEDSDSSDDDSDENSSNAGDNPPSSEESGSDNSDDGPE